MERIILSALSLLALASCVRQPVVSVNADFTTNKEVYEIYEDVIITNVSTATNDIIVACKWEWGSEYVWGKQLEKPLSFDSVGEKEIKLTAVTNSNVSGTCIKKIMVQDTNIRPVADFDWSPKEGITAGDEVQFTDKSTDADGTITAWEWKIGANTVTGQNPKFTFNEFGDIEVTLTVTDNQRGKGSVTKVVHVEKNASSIELLWSAAYDSDSEARVFFTSPAVSPDGNTVYVFSSGNHLVAFGKDGTQKWSFDAGIHNPGTTKSFVSCSPSVDADGTIFLAIGNQDTQDKTDINRHGIYAVNPDGSQKWYSPYGYGWFINVIPLVLQDKIFVATKRNPSATDYPDLWSGGADNGRFVNKGDGSYAGYLQVKRGSHGGVAATKEENFIVHTDSKYGSRVFWKEGDGWKYYGAAAGQNAYMLGYTGVTNTEIGFTSFMAIDASGKVYILYGKASGSGSLSSEAVLFCYDLTKYNKEAGTSPEWTLDLDGENKMCYGLGTVIGEDGTIYVSTSTGITAVNPDGTKKWFASASGNEVWGCPAVDKSGNVYYSEITSGLLVVLNGSQPGSINDASVTAGKLVKLNPDGSRASEITLGQSLCSSPAIAPDGTIYCNSVKDGKPTLSAVKGTAPAASGWSQFGGNPRKTCKQE